MKARRGIVNNFIELFFEAQEGDEINEKEFVDNFNKVDIMSLTSPRKFREYTSRILKAMEIVVRNVELVMNSTEIIKSPFYKRINNSNSLMSSKKAEIRLNKSSLV